MDHTILWITGLCFLLMLIACITAYGAHSKSTSRAVLWSRTAFWVLLLISLIPFIIAVKFKISGIRSNWLFVCTLFFTVCYIAGARLIMARGLKRTENHIAARLWPGARLLLALVILLILLTGIMQIMNLKVMGNRNRILLSTTGEAIKILPAKLPASMDAGLYYEKAFEAFGNEKDPAWLINCSKPGFIPESVEAEDFIKGNREVLDILKQAAGMPGFSISINPSNLPDYQIPRFSRLRRLGFLVCLSSKLKAIKEGPEAAVLELEILNKLTEHLYNRKDLVSLMVAGSMESMRISTLEFILSRDQSPGKTVIAKPVKQAFSLSSCFHDAMKLEHIFMKQALLSDNIFSGNYLFNKNDSIIHKLLYGRFTVMLYRTFMLQGDLDYLTKTEKKLDNVFKKTFSESIKDFKDIFSWSENLGVLTRFIIPTYSGYYEKVTIAAAKRNLTDLALAASAYRSDNGVFPDNPETLVPEYIKTLPVDPFDGKPMKFKVEEGGIDIFSTSRESTGRIHFYLGAEIYDKYRYQPALKKQGKEK